MPATKDPEEITIAVMGVTGTGKSYFIKEVSGISDVKVSGGLHSCTAEVEPYTFPHAGAKITLVDTPGFNDTTKSDTEVLRYICAWMSSSYKEGKRLSRIIYLHRITNVRMDGSSIKYVKMFQRLCGPDALKNVLLTTTHWSNVDLAQGESREKELRDGDFWGGLITAGASVVRFAGTRVSGLELIDKLMGNKPRSLRVQDELKDEGVDFAQTGVGKFLSDELILLQKEYQKDLEDVRSELRKAVKERDDLLKEILEDELARSRRKLEKVAAEKERLASLHADAMRKLEKAVKEKEEERKRNNRAVIAVSSRDIRAHTEALFTPYQTVGRLIYDMDDAKEFVKEPFNIEIRFQYNPLFLLAFALKTAAQLGGSGMIGTNYIIYNEGYYQCVPDRSIERASQKFLIFAKC